MQQGQVCKNCGRKNDAGALYCLACGHILPAGMERVATHALEDEQSLKPQIRWGTAYFGDHSVLRIHVRHSGEIVETRFKEACVLGREIEESHPDLDLTPYGAVKLGVSRQHVRLTQKIATIMVEDLGSRNGTFLNGERLIPKQPRVLRNEDELRLGHMVLRISFRSAPKPDANANADLGTDTKPDASTDTGTDRGSSSNTGSATNTNTNTGSSSVPGS